MLRIKTKEAGSWLIGAVAGVCAMVVTLTTLDLSKLWWVVLVATIGTFVGAFRYRGCLCLNHCS